MVNNQHINPVAGMRYLYILAILFSAVVCSGSPTPARAQIGGGSIDFGALESGVLPGGTELPDLTGDTLDPEVEARQPKRAQALPPPDDLFNASSRPPTKKRR
jgi:hypothetical protein